MKFIDLKLEDLTDDILDNFSRYQEIKKVWQFQKGQLEILKFNEKYDWNDEYKLEIIKRLRNIKSDGGFIIGGFIDNELKAFVSVASDIFGSENQYRELKYIHVSTELRGQGIGKYLFEIMVERLKNKGVLKVYISANAAEESQMFYRMMGCTIAKEINQRRVEEEPHDCQLEYEIKY